MVLDDTTAFPVTFLGAMRIGAIPVAVSVLDKDDNFRHFVDDSYADVVVADAAVMPRLRAALEGRSLTFLWAGGPAPSEAVGCERPSHSQNGRTRRERRSASARTRRPEPSPARREARAARPEQRHRARPIGRARPQ